MKAADELLESCVRAFEATTSEPADGRATRARVLEAAERRIHRRPSRLKARAPVFLAVILASATSVAVTSLVRDRRAPAPVVVVEAAPSRVPSHLALRRSPRIPATAEAAGQAAEEKIPLQREADFYARAHRAHFAENAPERALTAWDQYLEKYPRGAFAPEARYNRALCLVRLGRWRAAAGALRPIAEGKLGSYRRKEAALLLDSLQLRDL